jgi:DNA-binding Xre family transcriptional regulator/molecular chaperone GrpE (heat shock protein)
MGSNRQLDLTLQLQELMHKVGINSFKELSRSTGTSAGTIAKIRSGQISTLRLQTIVKISGVLQISVLELIDLFSDRSILGSNYRSIEILQQEYQHLQQQFTQQRATLASEFQSQSLQTLESFLTYFPAAKYAAQNNPNFPASKILPLVQSIDRLISQWGVTIIGEIGTQLPYDSRWHQLIEGTAQTGDLVTVRYLGYRQDDKLIFRAKVSN